MTYIEANKECDLLYKCGIVAQPTIAVFGRTDEEHVYSVRHIKYFNPAFTPTHTPAIEAIVVDTSLEIDECVF